MGLFLFPPPKVATFNLLLVLTVSPVSFTFVNGGIPTTLEGPFKPVTVPLDDSFRGNAVDLPDTDPRVRRIVKGFEPEQISVSLSTTHDSVWISWITGLSLSLSSFCSFAFFACTFGWICCFQVLMQIESF